MSIQLLHQYQGFLATPDLWGHAPEQAPYALLPTTGHPLSMPDDQQLQHWQATLPPRLVLGKRAEHFLHHYLQGHPDYKVLSQGLQIMDEEKRTLGELDFLYQHQNQVYHLEQCYKFYVYCPKAEGGYLDHWLGPNLRDSLVEKLDKLRRKQFPLLHHPQAWPYLQQLGLTPKNIAPQLSFKAALFIPYGTTFPEDASLNPTCWRGYWLDWDTFLRQAPPNAQYHLPDKRDWGNAPPTAAQWFSYVEILPQLEQWLQQDRAPLCWVRHSDGSYARWFVVGWT